MHLTWALPYSYTPGATCPAIKSWLHDTVGDPGTIQLLRAFMAALLRGPAKYQKFLHLIGPSGTGKSTFIRLLQSLVGEGNTVTTDLRQLEQNRFEAATLYGKRLAMIADSDKYGRSLNTLKPATGQDPLRLERKHMQQAGSFIFEGLIVMASNESLATTRAALSGAGSPSPLSGARPISQSSKEGTGNAGAAKLSFIGKFRGSLIGFSICR